MEVSELILNNQKWKFDGKFPEHYKVAYGKTRKTLLSTQLWYFNTKIALETSIKKDKTKEIPKKELGDRIPQGLYLVKTGTRKDTLAKVYDSLSSLFMNNDKRLLKINLGNNIFTMFRDPKKDNLLNIIHCLEVIQEYDEYLASYFLRMSKLLHKLYDTESLSLEQFMGKYLYLVLNKYSAERGLALHADNIIRYDIEGPVCVISVGPEFSYIDFAPSGIHIENSQLTPVRIKIPEGSMYIMDGVSRLEWSHGIPFDAGFTKTKFSIMFKLPRLKNYKVAKHSSLFDTDIYESIINTT